MPADFGRTKAAVLAGVRAALLTGRWAIDWWEGDPRTKGERERTPMIDGDEFTFYFVRPAIKGKEGDLHHGAWSGECTFLTNAGCELPSDERPRECRLLEPRPGGYGNCVAHGASKRAASVAWARHDLWGLAVEIRRERGA